MKKRIEVLEEKESTTELGSLKEILSSWVLAVQNKRWDEALKIRRVADDHLSELEDISRPPKGSPKGAFINWIWFLNFMEDDTRKEFINATKSKTSTGYLLVQK